MFGVIHFVFVNHFLLLSFKEHVASARDFILFQIDRNLSTFLHAFFNRALRFRQYLLWTGSK